MRGFFGRLGVIMALITLGLGLTITARASTDSHFPNTTNYMLAQNAEPDTLIDAIFADLSQKLGRHLTRASTNWAWEEDVFTDAGLGCPKPGQTFPRKDTRGYKITITVDNVVYDYRAASGSLTFFRCSPPENQPAPTAFPTPLPQPTAAQLPTVTAPPTDILPAANPLRLAYIAADGNVHFRTQSTINGDLALTTDANVPMDIDKLQADPFLSTFRHYGDLVWSPDGRTLLFTEYLSRTLYSVVPGSGISPTALVKDFGLRRFDSAAATWLPDSTRIAYVTALPGSTDAKALRGIMSIPAIGGAPTRITDVITSCNADGGGDNQDPAQHLYFREKSGVYAPTTLAWIGATLYYSLAPCFGLTALNTDGTTRYTITNLRDVTFSPEGKRALAVTTTAPPVVVIIDLATGTLTPTPNIPATADQLAWSADGLHIIYTTLEPNPTVNPDPNSAIGQKAVGVTWPAIPGTSNTVKVMAVPIPQGAPEEYYSREGYRVGNIAVAPDGSAIVISFITANAPLVRLLSAAKTLDPEALARLIPSTELLYIQTDVRAIHLLAFGGQPVFSPLVKENPLTPITATPATCPGAPPIRLSIGTIAHVTPGDANTLRASPGGSATGSIPGGSAVAILDGPVCTANGIVWWKVNYNGAIGWTAEGQGSTYFMEP